MCIKITIHIIDKYHNSDFNEITLDKFARIILELSFWDNSLVVEYTAKMFLAFWKKTIKNNRAPLRTYFEKLLDYFFLKRFYQYIDLLDEKNEECNIKLSVLEILANYLNEFISNHNFIFICYTNFDFSKIRFNFLFELFSQIQKYFNLVNPKFNFLKKILTITYLNISNYILNIVNDLKKADNNTKIEVDSNYLKKYSDLSESWEKIIKILKLNKLKTLKENMKEIGNSRNINTKEESSDEYKYLMLKYSKSIANLLRNSYMVDTENINEVLGGKDVLSKVKIIIVKKRKYSRNS
jgi:hypothetical protein